MARIAALATLLVVALFALTAQVPSVRQEMSHRYRFVWERQKGGAESGPFRCVFPKDTTSAQDDTDLPTSADSLRHATWVHIAAISPGTGLEEFVIFSPQLMAIDGDGKTVDTLEIGNQIRTYTFGGCQIDSVHMLGTGPDDIIHIITVTD